ncbi:MULTISPECIES: type-F conjugative transfer system pilin assembly protein TrbC [Sphingomonadaceae]|uniref:type-F conjugative transfer system pilin assembly protein TrbC n=1 Tax=Sphingomonadales TaxID=204457 RepID=UPI00200E9B2F|nr:type-F conjugative transfer system pilin assembly protein TrbC [Sphingobium sp. TKS]
MGLVVATAFLCALELPGAAPGQTEANRPAPLGQSEAQKAGDNAMERLRAAVAGRKQDSVRQPSVRVPAPSEADHRRLREAIAERVTSPAIDTRARATLEKGKAALAAQREAAAEKLAQALGLAPPDLKAIAGTVAPAGKAWVPVLFVSSSIPAPILRTYAAQLERAGGVFAFRGMPGGLSRVAPMAKLSAEILRIDPGCEGPACAMRNVQLIVDPLVFRQHGVMRVPALAMVPGDPTQPYCEREDDSPRASQLVYGDAALSGLLDEYARLGSKEEVRDAQARLEGR